MTAMTLLNRVAVPNWVEEGAFFSDAEHRIWLRRRLGMFGVPVAFILHNPSTASFVENDPTVRRGIGFAASLGASDLIFVNAATGVATNADQLADMDDPIGPMADEALRVAAEFCLSRGGMLIAAWGAPKGKVRTRRLMEARFQEIARMGLPLHVLRLTSSGYPEHPLYLPASLRPVPWTYHPE
ncbi:hypothetical protein BSFA1_80740 (plasmid) [Burkholderia sp. SFA1]|nr:hypothetical protein BSFA1_80740 [Burkholderia sp. SFA1]